MLGVLLIVACLVILVLVVARPFGRLMDIEERRRHGLPYEDLIKLDRNLPTLLIIIGGILFVVVAYFFFLRHL